MPDGRGKPPEADEIEISIFGPGKGEAIAVHLGGGAWLTVDSCVNQATRENVLISYFDDLGIDVEASVQVVVGTHAHDDHIAGIAQVYEAAKSAIFVCSSAITSEEFLRAVAIDETVAGGVRPSIRDEYRRIFDEAKRRRGMGRGPIWRALESRVLWSRAASTGLPSAEVRCLSPSDEAVTRSLDELARHAVAEVGGRRRFTSRDPNEFAVALWISFGDRRMLLGADLPSGPSGCGWTAILDNLELDGKAEVFKVPHHGSVTGHHDDVWKDLLQPNPIALLTPFRGGRKPLPSPQDIDRIKRLTSRAYITAAPRVTSARRSPVSRTRSALGNLASNIRDPWGSIGHVRARRLSSASDWRVELFKPAYDLATRT